MAATKKSVSHKALKALYEALVSSVHTPPTRPLNYAGQSPSSALSPAHSSASARVPRAVSMSGGPPDTAISGGTDTATLDDAEDALDLAALLYQDGGDNMYIDTIADDDGDTTFPPTTATVPSDGGNVKGEAADTGGVTAKPAGPPPPVTVAEPVPEGKPATVTPFLSKLYGMVDDKTTDEIISWWSHEGVPTLCIWNPVRLASEILPSNFKHNNFASFVRQLHTYGFRKVDPDKWSFHHPYFRTGRKDLLAYIHRRRKRTSEKSTPVPSQPNAHQSVEVGSYGGNAQLAQQLLRDKNALLTELVRVRQQQSRMMDELQESKRRQEKTEQQVVGLMSFLNSLLQQKNAGQIQNAIEHFQQQAKHKFGTNKRPRQLEWRESDDSDGAGGMGGSDGITVNIMDDSGGSPLGDISANIDHVSRPAGPSVSMAQSPPPAASPGLFATGFPDALASPGMGPASGHKRGNSLSARGGGVPAEGGDQWADFLESPGKGGGAAPTLGMGSGGDGGEEDTDMLEHITSRIHDIQAADKESPP